MRRKRNSEDHSFWISVGDLMSGLLILFILLTAFAFYQISDTSNIQRKVFALLEEKLKEVGSGLEIDGQSGTIAIADKILFPTNSSNLKPEGKLFLSKFIPILSSVICHSVEINKEISSVDIEGYSSQKGSQEFYMMQLSLERSLYVWDYILEIKDFDNKRDFLNKVKVCGWGNMKATSSEDLQKDRKVVFKLQFVGLLDKIKAYMLKDEYR